MCHGEVKGNIPFKDRSVIVETIIALDIDTVGFVGSGFIHSQRAIGFLSLAQAIA